MAKRNLKNRHNVNEARVVRSNNSDLSGYDKMFKFKSTIGIYANGGGDTSVLHIENLFGNNSGNNTDALQFNYEIQELDGTKIGSFDHNNNSISDIKNDFSAPAVVTEINSGEITGSDREVIVYINGQFGQLKFIDGGVMPEYGVDSSNDGDSIGEYTPFEIMQWGSINENKDWTRYFKAHNGNNVQISATDEPKFVDGIGMYRAFEDTTNNVFTADALASVGSWDSDRIGDSSRVFENGSDKPNLNNWSFSGGMQPYGFFMRTNMDIITNGGKNIRTKTINGWAGFFNLATGSSFQAAEGNHDWSNLNVSKVEDADYFAWNNVKANFMGDFAHWDLPNLKTAVGMFGNVQNLTVDPRKWDLRSLENGFFMFAQEDETYNTTSTGTVLDAATGWSTETYSDWNGRIPVITCKALVDIHSMFKNRHAYNQDLSGLCTANVVIMRSAFAGSGINFDFSKWDFSGIDARSTEAILNADTAPNSLGGFVRDCVNMSDENIAKLLERWAEPYGQGGLPSDTDSAFSNNVGSTQSVDFGQTYELRYAAGTFASDSAMRTRINDAVALVEAKGWTINGLDLS